MMRLPAVCLIGLALFSATALASRQLTQAMAPMEMMPTMAPAPGPGMMEAPVPAPTAESSVAISPAEGPVVGGTSSCTVEIQASLNEQINGTSASYSGPACVVVQDNLDGAQCQAQAAATMRSYMLITDIGCVYPAPQDCSTYTELTSCNPTQSNSITLLANAGSLNMALASNELGGYSYASA